MSASAEKEAIKRVIAGGVVGDFCDVVDAVRQDCGLKVSAALVEQVYSDLKNQSELDQVHRLKQVGTSLTAKLSEPVAQPSATPVVSLPDEPGFDWNAVMSFVESMGGFAEAHDAITRLKERMGRLAESTP